jgi:hypothetical protein
VLILIGKVDGESFQVHYGCDLGVLSGRGSFVMPKPKKTGTTSREHDQSGYEDIDQLARFLGWDRNRFLNRLRHDNLIHAIGVPRRWERSREQSVAGKILSAMAVNY